MDRRTDASSNLISVLGLLAADDTKAAGHRNRTIDRLQPQQSFNVEGVSRFEFDDFYYSSIYSPGDQHECEVPEPVWPQMSMYVGMGEHFAGQDAAMLSRLHWFVSVMGVGFMAPGEAVD